MALAAQARRRHVSDAFGEPGSGKTWVALATLRRAKFDIGVRSSKDGKSGAWWWTLPPPEDE